MMGIYFLLNIDNLYACTNRFIIYITMLENYFQMRNVRMAKIK